MKRNIFNSIAIFSIVIFAIGCSGKYDPVQQQSTGTPDVLAEFNLPLEIQNDGDRNQLGIWSLEFDSESMSANVITYRGASQHFNVTASIPTPSIRSMSFNPLTGIWDLELEINNNSPYDAYDLRLIFYTNDRGVKLLNSNDWTGMWDIPGGAQINPFVAYAKTVNNRLFASQTQHSEQIQLYLPEGVTKVDWAVDASFPNNCGEPYSIESFNHFRLKEPAGSHTEATVEIFDWQDNVSDVSLYCPIVTGESLVQFSHDSFNKWNLELYNNNGALAGNYTGVIIATSDQKILYDLVTITVTEQTVAELTIFFYLWDADLTDWVSVNVNEMEVVGSVQDELNIIALREENFGLDQYILEIAKDPGGYNGEIISPRIDDRGEVIAMGGSSMGNPQTLVNYLNWGIREYPARHYGIIEFGHGNGPFSIIPDPPWLSFTNGMQVWTLRDALKEVLDAHPEIDKFEFVHFESCLMGWAETAYGIMDVTKVGVASEMVMSGNTAEYSVFLNSIVENIETYNARDASASYVQSYLDFGMSDLTPTLAAWDTDIFKNEVVPSLEIFSQELLDALSGYKPEIQAARQATGSWGQWCDNREAVDLGYFAECIIDRAGSLPTSLIDAAVELRSDIEDAVYFHGHYDEVGTGCWHNETGLQIWFPEDYSNPGYESRRSNYTSLGMDALLWDDFLDEYDN